jgi:hypothetical protein
MSLAYASLSFISLSFYFTDLITFSLVTSHTLSHPSLAPFVSPLVPSSAISHHHSRALSCSFSHHIVILAPSLIASRIVSPYLAAFSILSCLLTLSCDAIAIIVLL